jgi:dienelactone hydrolase
LRKLSDVVPNEDGLITNVETGSSRWGDVYKVLEPLDRMVVGGRHSWVGASGFTLGGEVFVRGLTSSAEFEIPRALSQMFILSV